MPAIPPRRTSRRIVEVYAHSPQTSEKDSSSSMFSRAGPEFDSARGILRPADEVQEKGEKGIDRDVWIDTLPFPNGLPPSSGCGKPREPTRYINTEREVHKSSPNDGKPSPGGPFELEAMSTTFDAQVSTLGQSLYGGSPAGLTENKVLEFGTNHSLAPGALGGPVVSPEAHQLVEDGKRTPPRRSSRRVSNDAYVSTSLHSDLSERRRLLQRDLFDAGKMSLFYTLKAKNDRMRPKTAVLNVVALQRMNIHGLQEHLAEYAGMSFKDGQMNQYSAGVQKTLNLYCDAVRNLDFMREKAVGGYDHDPFLIKSSRALERGVLESSGLIPDHLLPKGDLPLPCDHEHPLLSNESGGRHYANEQTTKKQRIERFAMASFGGLLIIVPMLIMANVPGKVASLVTSCVAITIFAALVTLVTKLGPHEVLASVAAYAAVLVVFVGLSLEKR